MTDVFDYIVQVLVVIYVPATTFLVGWQMIPQTHLTSEAGGAQYYRLRLSLSY